MKKFIIIFSIITSISSCSSYEFHKAKNKQITKVSKVLIGYFQSRNLNYDPFVVDNFRDTLRFELFKKGYKAELLHIVRDDDPDLMNEKTKKLKTPKTDTDKIKSIKYQCKKAKADILLQGVISEKEIGDIISRKRSTSISIQIYDSKGDKVGEAQYITSKTLSSAMRLKGIAAKIVASMKKLK